MSAFYTNSGDRPLFQRFVDAMIPGTMRDVRNTFGPNRTGEERARAGANIVSGVAGNAGPLGLIARGANRFANGPNNPYNLTAEEFHFMQDRGMVPSSVSTPEGYSSWLMQNEGQLGTNPTVYDAPPGTPGRQAFAFDGTNYSSNAPASNSYNYYGNEINSGPVAPSFTNQSNGQQGTAPQFGQQLDSPTMEVDNGKPNIAVGDITNGTTTRGVAMPNFSGMNSGMTGAGIPSTTARDSYASSHGGARSTTDIGNVLRGLGDLGSQGGGLDPQRNRDVGVSRQRKNIAQMLAANPNDERALRWKQELRDAAMGGK